MGDKTLFPVMPDDLSGTSDEQLQSLLEEMVGIAERVQSQDAELIGEMTVSELLDEMHRGVEAIETLRSEMSTRDEAAEEATEQLAELTARALGEASAEAEPDASDADGTEDADGEEAETEAEPEAVLAEPVAASSRPVVRRRAASMPRRNSDHAPKPATDSRRPTILAAADIQGISAGGEVDGMEGIANALLRRHRTLGRSASGIDEKVPVVTIVASYDEDRILDPNDDGRRNWQKINSVVGKDALVASGGLCSPTEGYYEVQLVSTDQRPVRDALARFQAARGGIRFAAPPALSSVTTGVGKMTAANDAIGGTTATKTCQTVACPSITEVKTDMIYHCIKFGNLGARAFPEFVQQFTELTLAAQARVAETAMLDAIGTSSTAVTGAQVGGANNTLLGQILTAAAGQRSRHRMDPNTRLRVLLPAWVREALVTDLVRSQFGRFDWSVSGVEALLRTFNIEPTFYLDGATGAGQVFGAQAASALLGFPTTAVWYIFPEGTFIFVDGGELDIGLVRDSTLNATNDFQMFGETFEQVAFAGVESLKVTSTFCATGEVTLPRTLSCAVGP